MSATGRTELPSLASRLFHVLVAVSVGAVVISGILAALAARSAVSGEAAAELSREANVVSAALDAAGCTTQDQVAAVRAMSLGDLRVTLVAADGTVLYDNREEAAQMPNHSGRTEVADALANGTGSYERLSATVGYVSVYRAVRLASGGVVRLSVDEASTMATFTSFLPVLVCALAALVVVSFFASRLLARRIVGPIVAIDPGAAQATTPYAELAPLTRRLDEQRDELEGQMVRLEDSEQMRREFTSNVTHELKTPLASISAAAELIRDGIARPEDIPDFAGRICDDSARLTSLVNDILTLSKLDESERAGARSLLGSVEVVDLSQVCRTVISRLAPAARAADVTVSLTCTQALVEGSARLLDELVSNLVANAVRYNRPSGTVTVTCAPRDGHPVLTVADTGIGIARDQQSKVFERFYRVDTSRSRESGGTGLGLAIVKHAATFHGATIALASEPGRGTTITVTFPACPSTGE